MTTPIEHIVATQKSQLDTALDWNTKALSGIEKLLDLNLQVARTALADHTAHAKALLGAKDAHELLALHTAAAQPAVDKALAYGRQVQEALSATQTELTQLAETQVAGVLSQVNALVDTAVKNAPSGSEGVVALIRSSVSAANNVVETAQKTAKQAFSTAETHLQAVTQSVAATAQAATQTTTKPVKKAA